jgi:hypothetical protein
MPQNIMLLIIYYDKSCQEWTKNEIIQIKQDIMLFEFQKIGKKLLKIKFQK